MSEPVLIAGEPDPYPRLARLREAGPFAYDPHDDVYFVVSYPAACNRDGAHFAQADDFRLERHPNDHLSFSSFTHFCPGAPLVRMQAELLLRGLLERYQVQVKGPLTWQRMNRFRGLEHLTVGLERG